ncbi:MAG: hypothetical protein D3925_13080 [Candidatus Electrothrix sp. AR5]|nr:hypothetical protein [Candidatus Electrothrix sp. AR5]
MNGNGTVKVNFTIENLPKIYTETGQTWENEPFSYDLQISEEGGAGKLEINKADVLPDEIEGVIQLIEKKADMLLMVYKFKTSCFYSDIKKEWQKYCVDGKGNFTLGEKIDVEDIKGWMAPDEYTVLCATVPPPIVHMSCESSKIEFPNLKELKGIDDNLKRHLLTYIQTKELNSLSGNYHDDILKRWFLILEEIEEDTGNMDYQNIKRARHFVSHSICDTKCLALFIF